MRIDTRIPPMKWEGREQAPDIGGIMQITEGNVDGKTIFELMQALMDRVWGAYTTRGITALKVEWIAYTGKEPDEKAN